MSAIDTTIDALRAGLARLDAARAAARAAADAIDDEGGDAPVAELDEGYSYVTAADEADTAARVAYAASTDERPALAAMRDLLADGAALPTALRAYRAATYIEPTPFDDDAYDDLAVATGALASAIDNFNALVGDEAPPMGDPDDDDDAREDELDDARDAREAGARRPRDEVAMSAIDTTIDEELAAHLAAALAAGLAAGRAAYRDALPGASTHDGLARLDAAIIAVIAVTRDADTYIEGAP